MTIDLKACWGLVKAFGKETAKEVLPDMIASIPVFGVPMSKAAKTVMDKLAEAEKKAEESENVQEEVKSNIGDVVDTLTDNEIEEVKNVFVRGCVDAGGGDIPAYLGGMAIYTWDYTISDNLKDALLGIFNNGEKKTESIYEDTDDEILLEAESKLNDLLRGEELTVYDNCIVISFDWDNANGSNDYDNGKDYMNTSAFRDVMIDIVYYINVIAQNEENICPFFKNFTVF